MIPIARLLNVTLHYFAFVVAVNWTSVLQLVLFLSVNVLIIASAAAGEAGAFLFTLTLTISCAYRYSVTRVALQTTLDNAIGLVAFDVVLGLLLSGVFDRTYEILV